MTAKPIMQSVGSFFKDQWKRHRVVLGLMVAAVTQSRRLGVAALGRFLPTRSLRKHAIKRVDRFLSNRRFDDRRAQETLLRTVVGPRKRILVPVDWTKVRQWPALVAGVVSRGRSIPVLWSVWDRAQSYKSLNAFENGFFTWLAHAMPRGVEAIVLLDRGFKRVELVKHLRRCGLRFVIRTGGNTHARHAQYCGRLDRWIVRRGQKGDLPDALLRPSRPITVRVVALWDRGQREPWVLMTDLVGPIEEIARLYGKRFQIEETFRDEKDARFGLFLGHVRMTRADRVERMLLVAAVSHFLAMLVGGAARRAGLDRGFRANTVRDQATHSDFTLGLFFVVAMRWKRSQLLRNFYAESNGEFGG